MARTTLLPTDRTERIVTKLTPEDRRRLDVAVQILRMPQGVVLERAIRAFLEDVERHPERHTGHRLVETA